MLTQEGGPLGWWKGCATAFSRRVLQKFRVWTGGARYPSVLEKDEYATSIAELQSFESCGIHRATVCPSDQGEIKAECKAGEVQR